MNISEFKEQVFKKAIEENFDEYEIYYCKEDNLQIYVYSQAIDKYSVNTTIGVSFRGIYNGKMGYSYTETLDIDYVEMLVNCAKMNSLTIENEDLEFIYDGGDKYAMLDNFNSEISTVSVAEKIKLALSLEKETIGKSDKVVNIDFCRVDFRDIEYGIINSKGVDVCHRKNHILAGVKPVVSDGDRRYDAVAYIVNRDFKNIDVSVIAEEAVQEALASIDASEVKSGTYKLVLRNEAAATLLKTFSDLFSAEKAQKGFSLLKDKVGKIIASPILTIIDDPHLNDGLASSPFDAEGVATYKKYILEKGCLNTLLHNLKTATKEGIVTTGNASKLSYKSSLDVSPSNLYIEKGSQSFNELVSSAGEGIIITNLQGMNAGANKITGDFSLAAKGFVIKEGRIERPIEQITIVGNFFKLIEQVEAIGDDLKFLGDSNSYFGSPSIIINSIFVAGN